MTHEQELERKREERLNQIRARLESFAVDARGEIIWLMEQVWYLTMEMNCDICDGQPEKCAPCICGGTGKLRVAAANRLTRMAETEMKLGDALYALRGLKAKWPEVVP